MTHIKTRDNPIKKKKNDKTKVIETRKKKQISITN